MRCKLLLTRGHWHPAYMLEPSCCPCHRCDPTHASKVEDELLAVPEAAQHLDGRGAVAAMDEALALAGPGLARCVHRARPDRLLNVASAVRQMHGLSEHVLPAQVPCLRCALLLRPISTDSFVQSSCDTVAIRLNVGGLRHRMACRRPVVIYGMGTQPGHVRALNNAGRVPLFDENAEAFANSTRYCPWLQPPGLNPAVGALASKAPVIPAISLPAWTKC